MRFPPLLAHGALGNWDELIFLGVAIAFVILMAASWLRARARQTVDPPQRDGERTAPAERSPRGSVELE